MENPTRILLVRHGQTEWNLPNVERYRGRVDVPLNEEGVRQAEATGRRIAAEWPVAAVYSSPLTRALRTAQEIARHFKLEVQPHNGLIDINLGQWQGLTVNEVRQQWPDVYDAWRSAPHTARIPDGETLAQLRARGADAIRDIVARHPGQTIAAVAHTAINHSILLAMLGLGDDRFWRLGQDNCAINVVECAGAQATDFTLVTLNDTAHVRKASA
jgi:phosphoserine phosphatase